jgi:gliding motility-associated-like protein
MKLSISILGLLLLPSVVLAQSSCPNLDFENGDFSNWSGTYGCNPIDPADYEMYYDANTCSWNFRNGTYTTPSGQTLDEPQASQPNNINGQQAIVSSAWNGGVDPYVPPLSLTPPTGGTRVARIGDYYNGARVGDLKYNIDVDSNNSLLTAYYAIVLEAPGGDHENDQNPYFRIRLIDPDGNSVECVEYIQDGVAGAEGFNTYNCGGPCVSSADGNQTDKNNLIWRDWTAISVNLLPYMGQNVTIEFVAGDCALTGHLGYAYIDLSCRRNEIITQTNYVCKGVNGTMEAPSGMSDYEWHYGDSLGPVVGNSQNLSVSDTGWYYCRMTPFSTAISSCPFTLGTYIQEAPSDPLAGFTALPTPVCIGEPVQCTDTSITANNSPIANWEWDFGDGSTSSGQNPSHSYSDSGTYDIQLIITTIDGCLDTALESIYVLPLLNPDFTVPTLVCSQDTAFDLVATPLGGIWSGTGIVDSIAGTFDPVSAFANGNSVSIRYSVGTCDEFVEKTISITPQLTAEFDPAGPFCNDDAPYQLTATQTGGTWSGTGVDANGSFDPASAVIGNNDIQYIFTQACGDTSLQTIVVNERKDASITPVDPICEDEADIQLQSLQAGGIWSGTGVDANGLFSPVSAGPGSHTIKYVLPSPCPDSSEIVIEVLEKYDATFDPAGPFCNDDAPFQLIPTQAGGAWSGTGVDANGLFSPSSASIGDNDIQYIFTQACGDTSIQTIVVNERKDASITPVDPICEGAADIQLQTAQTGGIFSGVGVDANGLFSPSNAGPGSHTIKYVLPSPCPDSSVIVIEVQEKFDPQFAPVGPFCETDANVQLIANDNGGTWTGSGINGNGIFSPTNAGPGTHIITYAFSGLCAIQHIDSIVVEALPDASINAINPLCFESAPLQLTSNEAGGDWSGDVDANGIFNPLSKAPGIYKAYYSFTGVCSVIDSINIEVLEPIAIESEITNASCKDLCNGKIILTVDGGWSATPYQFVWSTIDQASTSNRANLCDGEYSVVVTDLYQCKDSATFIITEPEELRHQMVVDSATCDQNNGIAEIVAITGGTPPYRTVWDNGVVALINPNIAAGDYPVNITDSLLCTNVDTAFIANANGPTFELEIDSLVCNDADNAVARLVNIRGGVKPFTVVWSTGLSQNLGIHPNLSAGNYGVNLQDATGCNFQDVFSIENPDKIAVIDPISPVCEQDASFQLTASALGGIWEGNGVSPTGIFTPSDAGVGVHRISYSQGLPCLESDTISIQVLPNQDASFDPAGPFCSADDDYQLIAKQNNGTWSGIGVDEFGVFSPSQLSAGQYAITYSIAGQCGDAQTQVIQVNSQSNAEISGPESVCPKDDPIQLIATEPGGTWSGEGVDRDGIFYPALVQPGLDVEITYIIQGLCPDTGKLQIKVNPIIGSTIVPAGPFCEDASQIIMQAENPNGVWSGTGIVDTSIGAFSPIAAGEGFHTIQYTIPGNCGSTDTTIIEIKNRPVANIHPIDPICYGADDIVLTAVTPAGIWGGVADVNGNISPKSLGSGTHHITYAFNGFCPSNADLDIEILEPIAIDLQSTMPRCFEECNGTAVANVSGGWEASNYTYIWSNNSNNAAQQNALCKGTYNLVVLDKFACSDTVDFIIDEPKELAYDITSDSSSCGQANGSASIINLVGGTKPYQLAWSNGIQSALNPNLQTGNYDIIVTDANGCKNRQSIAIVDKAGPIFNIVQTNLMCYGDENGEARIRNISGGTAPYDIKWSTGSGINDTVHKNLPAGTFMVSIFDAKGCSYSSNFTIEQPSKVNIDLTKDTVLCVGQKVDVIAQAHGGIPSYQYFWNNVGPSANSATAISDTTLNVYAIDDNGCPSEVKSVNVVYSEPLTIQAHAMDTILCAGESTVLEAYITGGVGNYNLQWSDGSTANPRPITPQGSYGDTVVVSVTISDQCSPDISDNATIVFYEPPHPEFVAFPTEGCEPLVVEFVNLSENVATYAWDLGDGTQLTTSENFNHVYQTGTYDVILDVISPDGCKGSIEKIKFIKTFPNPKADFVYSPTRITKEYDNIQFLDKSLGNISTWDWEFMKLDSGIVNTSDIQNPLVKTPENLGKYIAKLTVSTIHGCLDSIYKTFEIEPDFSVYVPNAYTPNFDGVNEFFKPIVRGIQEDHYRLNIYDRWGELIWYTEDSNEGWDGKMLKNPVDLVKTDVYVWQLIVRDFKGKQHDFTGHVTLLK